MLDSPNADTNWVFDTTSKKSSVSRFFTLMTGSVVTSGQKPNKKGDKENVRPAKKAKARPSAKSRGAPVPNLPEEQNVSMATIACSVGVRNKLWVDDLIGCVNHVTQSIHEMDNDLPVMELKSHLIRTGLIFAMTGSIVLETPSGTKQHKRWSTLRPALKQHGLHMMVQARQNMYLRL